MSNHESPMLKSARQMSEARAYGFNSSGTMAGQVGADAAQRERNAAEQQAQRCQIQHPELPSVSAASNHSV